MWSFRVHDLYPIVLLPWGAFVDIGCWLLLLVVQNGKWQMAWPHTHGQQACMLPFTIRLHHRWCYACTHAVSGYGLSQVCTTLCKPMYTDLLALFFIITSRGSPPSASFHYYGRVLTTFLHWHFYNGASTMTILVRIMLLGHCMFLVIASDIVSWLPIPGLMECKASDYAESQSSK